MEVTKFTLIVGPMMSGKSHDLIGFLKPFEIAKIPFGFYQPKKNVRDEHIQSRVGSHLAAKKVESLTAALEKDLKVVGVDEVHMFPVEDAEAVAKLLKRGTMVFISGLDLDYRGQMMPLVQKLLELGPSQVIYKRAVCDNCRIPDAIYTQIFDREGKLILDDLPQVVPEDGTYRYVPLCRRCFVRKSDLPLVSENTEEK